MAYVTVGTWDVTGAFPLEVANKRRGVRSPVDGGMVQRRQTYSSESSFGQAGVRTFRLSFPEANKSEYNRAIELWKKSNGGAEGLSYTLRTPYSGATETVIVRMVAAPLVLSQNSSATGGSFTFAIDLEEMLHAP